MTHLSIQQLIFIQYLLCASHCYRCRETSDEIRNITIWVLLEGLHLLAGLLSLRPQGSWPQQTPSLDSAWHPSSGGLTVAQKPPPHLANSLAASLGSCWWLGLASRTSAALACCDWLMAPWQNKGAVLLPQSLGGPVSSSALQMPRGSTLPELVLPFTVTEFLPLPHLPDSCLRQSSSSLSLWRMSRRLLQGSLGRPTWTLEE